MAAPFSPADIANMANIMAAVNLKQALEGKEPYFHTLEVKIEELKIPRDEKTQLEIIERAYVAYRATSTVKSTIDITYKQYGQLLFAKLLSGATRIPNGCCTQKTCYINQFYEIVVGMLRKEANSDQSAAESS